MGYNKWWQVQNNTNYCGSDEIGDIIERMAQDNRDPLEILIEEEEEEEHEQAFYPNNPWRN